jgi:hypothetical protein
LVVVDGGERKNEEGREGGREGERGVVDES